MVSRAWPLKPFGLMVSGRISFEITQKAAVTGISLVCGVSAASGLAIELAEELGTTVIGFLRDGSSTLYRGKGRVTGCRAGERDVLGIGGPGRYSEDGLGIF